jgi:hypothetical protein
MMHREYVRTSGFLFSQVPQDTSACTRTPLEMTVLTRDRNTDQMSVYQFCYASVSSITSTVMIGEELAHSGGWDKIVMEYFPEAWRIRNALWHWPRPLRPIVKPCLVRNNQLENILDKAEKFLEDPIKKRRDPNNQDVDILKFLADYNESPRKVSLQIVGIITGAVSG